MNSLGMNRKTGRWLSDLDHLKQSIQVILTTRIGMRIERREFGSLIPNIVDYPIHEKNVLLLYAAIANALAKHEPRLKLSQLSVSFGNESNPTLTVNLEGVFVGVNGTSNIDLKVSL